MSEVLPAYAEVGKLVEAQSQLKQVMTGSLPGFISPTPTKQQIDKKTGAYTEEADIGFKYAKALYEYASRRDLPYCIAGRKFMRIKSVAGKLNVVLHRGVALQMADVLKDTLK